jgi:signal transduction histidine kinase/CheY-like chemotaxis protein
MERGNRSAVIRRSEVWRNLAKVGDANAAAGSVESTRPLGTKNTERQLCPVAGNRLRDMLPRLAPQHKAGNVTDARAADGDEDADVLLTRWRERVLTGVLATSVAALIPAWLIHAWQSMQGISGAQSGMWLGLASIVVLSSLLFAPSKARWRTAVAVGLGFSVIAACMLMEGFAPAQCVLICVVTNMAALLYSSRIAALIMAASAVSMLIAAYAYSHGLFAPNGNGHMDVTNPVNWLRVGLYTFFASATASVASSYLLGKLRLTLHARTALVAQLSDEVAQRERALAELERTQAQLLQAQKLEAIGQLAAGIAHDFNNTLSVITLEAELLKRQHPSDGMTRGADSLLGAAERGKQLTQQLLMFSRPRSLERPTIEGTQTFAECVDALRRLLPSEITFAMEIAPGPLNLGVQPSELQQLVLNLGINARDAMTGGGTIRLSLERQEVAPDSARLLGLAPASYALLTCSDTGCGMDEATLSRVFEPFFTTKRPGRGTGLGLTNVWNIAERAGGCVKIVSVLGEGTTLRVYLPIKPAVAARHADKPVQHMQRRAHETILVVEDDIRIRALLVATLADAGYNVLDAQGVDAALALERTHAGAIELLCTDVVMPGRPARELIVEFRARRPDTMVLVCSGYSEDEQIARGIRTGEFAHLDKPFNRAALMVAVRTALDRKRQESEQAQAVRPAS